MSGDSILFVSAWGTLGDIGPLIAVAGEFKRRGTRVFVAGVADFAPTAERFGVDPATEWTTLDVVEGQDLTSPAGPSPSLGSGPFPGKTRP